MLQLEPEHSESEDRPTFRLGPLRRPTQASVAKATAEALKADAGRPPTFRTAGALLLTPSIGRSEPTSLRKAGNEFHGGGNQFFVSCGEATVRQNEHIFQAHAHVEPGGGAG